MIRLVKFIFAALIIIVSGAVSGNDSSPTPPVLSVQSVPKQVESSHGSEPDEQSELRVPGIWMETPVELRPQVAPRNADVPGESNVTADGAERSCAPAAPRDEAQMQEDHFFGTWLSIFWSLKQSATVGRTTRRQGTGVKSHGAVANS